MPKKQQNQSTELVTIETKELASATPGGPLPSLILDVGHAGQTAWDDFFSGSIPNDHTRAAYERALRYFLTWAKVKIPQKSLPEITAGDVGRYMRELTGSIQKKKQHLSGLRKFFDLLVERHIIIINPAAVAKTERLQVAEGKTPIITDKQFRQLLSSLDLTTTIGLRNRAIYGILAYTAVRGGAVAKLDYNHYYDAGEQWVLHVQEKGGKQRTIPVSHDLKTWIDNYIREVPPPLPWRDPNSGQTRKPLFRTAIKRQQKLTDNPMTSHDISRMMKRDLKRAELPTTLSPHSFRAAIITDLLDQGESLRSVQDLAGHADPRTTRLYDRSSREVTRNLVERIRLGR
jgi:site-specific recombinase XerD